jgi:hypothetical protein
MTFWDRIIVAIRKGARGNEYYINQVEIYYERETIPPCIIEGAEKSYDFLAAYSSFDEVQVALSLPGIIHHISCMNMLDEFNMQYYVIDHSDTETGDIEEFYRDRPSVLEQEAADKTKKP